MKRCHCRPGCLSPLTAADLTVHTDQGTALVAHMTLVPIRLDGVTTSITSPLSKPRAS